MLEDKLNAARRARRQHIVKIAASVTGILVLSAVALVFSTSCCDFAKKDVADVEEVLERQPPVTLPVADTSVDDPAARQQYLDMLNQYQNELEPGLASIDLAGWQPGKVKRLTELKDAAFNEFAAANYAGALKRIKQATSLTEELIRTAGEEFQQAMTAAQIAYEKDDFDNARQQVVKAQMLNKASPEAKQLAEKINALGEILPLLKQASVAQVENNAEKELAIIEEILSLAPDREKQQARKQELLTRLSLQRYQSHIANAFAAIEKEDASAARKHINNARQIYPNRSEVKDVNSALVALEKEQRFARHARLATEAMREDNWEKAKQELTLALAEKPDDKTLKDLLQQTEIILSLQAQMERHLASPYRLADAGVIAQARTALAEAQAYREESIKLDRTASELSTLIDNMNKNVDVVVKSDNKTNVLVRGVGIVGMTDSKTIQLKPGSYKFEGKREGYKSKLIDVLVPYDKNQMQLTVVCDEPI
ncbi:MAG: hypothetical protein RLT87_02090 [Gammaproteobacteria bacterium]